MLVHLLLSLNWQSALILHTQELDPSFVFSLDESGIYYVDYDISSITKEFLLTSLLDVEKVLTPHFHLLLLCDVSTTVSVLRQMSGLCGTRSNSTVDFCHTSQVLVLGTSDDLPVLLDSDILLENVALLELPKRQVRNIKTRMWTLMFYPSGRAFTTVAFCDETDTNLTEVFPNVKFGYNGRQLTVVMQNITYGYGFEIIDKQRVSGYPFRVLKVLAQYMNFSYRIIPPREDEWGRNINGTWTGVFGMLQRKEADLAADILTIHIDRTDVSEYILPHVGEGKRVILYKKDTDVNEDHLMVLLRPFHPGVFSIFGGAFVIYIALLSFVRLLHKASAPRNSKENTTRHETKKDRIPQRGSATHNIMLTFFEVYGAALKQGSALTLSHDSERILIAGWWLFATIISTIYCVTMVATLTVKVETPPFSNLAELVSREDYTIGYDSSSITENAIQNSKQSHMVAFKRRIRDLSLTDPVLLGGNVTKHVQRVQMGKYAYITGQSLLPVIGYMCDLKAIDASFGQEFTAFHVPKSSPFKHDFEKTMYIIRDHGIMDREYQQWIRSIPQKTCPAEEFPKAVSLINVQSIFFAVGIGVSCCALTLITEIVWHRIERTCFKK